MLDSKNIIFSTRFADGILILYDTTRIVPDSFQNYVKHIHSSLQLNPNYEDNAQINLLYLHIIKKTTKLKIDIYRKPTTTDITINYLSNHPMVHKLAAYHYYINRMLSLPLTKESQATDWKPYRLLHAITTSH
jgi:hypothetical protein